MQMDIIIIAAMSANRVIGKNNSLPWSLKEDLAHFKKLTNGWPCVMGRKTWESLPQRPLPGRPNIVISKSAEPERRLNLADSGAEIFPSLQEAIKHYEGYEKIFICGGGSIYREALAIANKIELTVIHRQYEGDVFFPPIDPSLWEKTASADFDGYSFFSYNRHKEKTK